MLDKTAALTTCASLAVITHSGAVAGVTFFFSGTVTIVAFLFAGTVAAKAFYFTAAITSYTFS